MHVVASGKVMKRISLASQPEIHCMQPLPSAQLTGGQLHAASVGRRASRQLQRQSYVKLQLGQEGSGDVLTAVSIFPPNSRRWPCLLLFLISCENRPTLIYKCLNPVSCCCFPHCGINKGCLLLLLTGTHPEMSHYWQWPCTCYSWRQVCRYPPPPTYTHTQSKCFHQTIMQHLYVSRSFRKRKKKKNTCCKADSLSRTREKDSGEEEI